MRRRDFLTLTSAASTYAALPKMMRAFGRDAVPSHTAFDFAFLTDTHIRPDLDAPHGCTMAFNQAGASRPEFILQGGDLVVDAIGADRPAADQLFDLYERVEKSATVPVHHIIGNHDLFRITPASGVSSSDALYGKGLFQQRFGKTYSSFDHNGYHFVLLDSLQITPKRDWESRIDATQLAWLEQDLKQLPIRTPVIVSTHVPLVTGAASYAPVRADKAGHYVVLNAFEILPVLEQHNIVAVFQGHTHINEVVQFRGISYVSCGAVCGNWWHGTRWGTPEGFTIVSLRNGKISWRYQPTGFRSVDPQDT